MRKIIGILTLFSALFFGMMFVSIETVSAQAACSSWTCSTETVNGNTSQVCTGDPPGCVFTQSGTISCDPGYYACNRRLGCCQIGDPTDGGGGTNECTVRTDNCAYNWTPAPNMLLPGVDPNPYCRRPTYCPPLGNAQIQTGCCMTDWTDPDHPEGVCTTPQVKSVQCCPPGTAEGYTDTVSSNYTYTHSCYDNAGLGHICQNPTDIWIIDGRAVGDLCYTGRNNCDGDGENCETFPVWNFSTTCTRVTRTYSCVSTCNTTAPTAVSTPAGPNVGTSIVINWTPGANGVSQLFWVDEQDAGQPAGTHVELDAGCPTLGDCEASRLLGTTINSQTVYGLQPLTTYFYRIVTYKDTTCHSEVGGSFTTPASTGAISGTVYLDANNTCTDQSTPMNNVYVGMDGTTGVNTGVNGTFSFSGLTLNSVHDIGVTPPTGYTCSTASACNIYPCYQANVVTSSSGKRFYLTQSRAAWWQVMGGAIYAGSTANGTTVGSTIPDSIAAGSRYLILPGVGGTAAAAMRASGDAPSVGSGTVNSGGWSAKTTYNGKKMDYTYFAKEMGLVPGTSDWLTSTLNEQAYNAAKDYWYSNQDSVITTSWDIANGESYTVFVDGDLTISANINVAPGGFLAFIVNGDITVSPTVQYIEGIYVAQNNFVTSSTMPGTTDIPLVIEGNVAAWGTVDLNRDLVGNNSNTPAEMFKYRSDIISSMPDKMKAFVMMWGEVVPGTYEE